MQKKGKSSSLLGKIEKVSLMTQSQDKNERHLGKDDGNCKRKSIEFMTEHSKDLRDSLKKNEVNSINTETNIHFHHSKSTKPMNIAQADTL